MSDLDFMHEALPTGPDGPKGAGHFRRVEITHIMPDIGILAPVSEQNAARDASNVGMVSLSMPNGASVTLWPDGTIQVGSPTGECHNWQVHAPSGGNPAIVDHLIQPGFERM